MEVEDINGEVTLTTVSDLSYESSESKDEDLERNPFWAPW